MNNLKFRAHLAHFKDRSKVKTLDETFKVLKRFKKVFVGCW